MPTKTKTPRKKKERMPPEKHWKHLVAVLLNFYEETFTERTFEATSPRNLKLIVKELREHAEGLGVNWTAEIACKTLDYFLRFAFRLDMPEISFKKTYKFFIVDAVKYRKEIIEHIRLLKNKKQTK